MPQGYSLRWFQNDDLDTYVEGLNESLYDRYNRERFQWKFRDNPFTLGFNFAGSTAAAVKAGSTTVCDINFGEIEPKDFLGQSNHLGSYSLNEIKSEEAHLLYSEWATVRDQPHIHRSLDYLKWRFEKSPLRDYKIYNLMERNTDLGYVVLSIVENAEGETIVGLDDFILNTTNPSAVIGAMAEMIKVEKDAAKIEFLTKKGATLENSLGQLNIEPDPRYTMILKPITGTRSPDRVSKVERRHENAKTSLTSWSVVNNSVQL